MTKCTNCQSNLGEAARFCPYCGTPVTRKAAPTAPGISQDVAPSSPIKADSQGTPKRTGELVFYALLFAVAGGLLILVVAPEFEGKYGSRLFGYVYFQTVESWAALIGGGVCLLLSGIFLLRAIAD